MPQQPLGPRKKRPREHVIADLSRNHVERFILEEGHAIERTTSDYGYDLRVLTCDKQGYVEPGEIRLQLKAAETLKFQGDDCVFDLDVRDYNLWVAEPMPVILVLFDATRRRAYWLYVQRYFAADTTRHPKVSAKTVRVRIPGRQTLSRRAVRAIRGAKQECLRQPKPE